MAAIAPRQRNATESAPYSAPRQRYSADLRAANALS